MLTASSPLFCRPQGERVLLTDVRQLASSGEEVVPSGDIHNSSIFVLKCVNISAQMLSSMFSICPLTGKLSSQVLLQNKIHQIHYQCVLIFNVSPNLDSAKL